MEETEELEDMEIWIENMKDMEELEDLKLWKRFGSLKDMDRMEYRTNRRH